MTGTDLLISLFLIAVVVCAVSAAAMLWLSIGKRVIQGWRTW